MGGITTSFDIDIGKVDQSATGMFETQLIDISPIKITPVNVTNKMLTNAGGVAPKSEWELDSDSTAQKLAKQNAQVVRLQQAKQLIYEMLMINGVEVGGETFKTHPYMGVLQFGYCEVNVYCPRDDGSSITCTPLYVQSNIADTIAINTAMRIDHLQRQVKTHYEDVIFTGSDFQSVKYPYDDPVINIYGYSNFINSRGKPAKKPVWDKDKRGFIAEEEVFGFLTVYYEVEYEVFAIKYDLPRPLTTANKLAFFYGTGLKDLVPAQIIVQRGGQGSLIKLPQKIEPSAATWESTGTNSTHTEDTDRRKTTKKRINGSDGRSWVDVEIPIEIALVNGMGKAMTFKMPDKTP